MFIKSPNYQYILESLLEKLKERQSYCPLCGGEFACDSRCILEDFWFEQNDYEDDCDDCECDEDEY